MPDLSRLPREVADAQERIASLVRRSNLVQGSFWQGPGNLMLKLENLNIGGSFKIRGATNTILQLSPEDLKHGIIASSAGNHAQAVAYVCQRLGIPTTIVMPERTPMIKIDSTKRFGAKVIVKGETFDDAYQAALDVQREQSSYFVHAFANQNVIYGQATVGAEILEDFAEVDCIIVPIGGGGLISGIALAAKAVKPDLRIIGVQSAAFPAMKQSFHDRQLAAAKVGETIADGIAVKKPAEITYRYIESLVDDIITVEEEEIVAAIMVLMERGHLIAEGAGAASYAGLVKLMQNDQLQDRENICCVISGGNLDANMLKRVITSGQVFSHRMMRIQVFVNDRPGELADILKIISSVRANLLEVHHNRLLKATQFRNVRIDLDLETMGFEHQQSIIQTLLDHQIKFELVSTEGNLI